MPFDITARKTGVSRPETYDFGADVAAQDANYDRYIAWAKATYPTQNPDGSTSVPNDAVAHRRAMRGVVRGLRDNIKRWEEAAAHAAVPPATDIAVN